MRIPDMSVVRNPPAWKAARGSKDRPIITQKIASDPKPQARSTVSYARRRIGSTASPSRCGLNANAPVTKLVPEDIFVAQPPQSRGARPRIRGAPRLEADPEKIAHGRQREQSGPRQPDPQ